MVQYGLMMTL